MEQNKVLMIIVSVAIFFAAIVGVGVALLYPREDEAVAAADLEESREFDPIEYVRRPERAPLTDTPEDDEPVVIVYGEADDVETDDERDTPEPAIDAARPGDPERTITVAPARRTEADASDAVESDDRESADTTESVEDAPRESVAAETREQRVTTPPSRPEPRRIRVTEYWIQLIASPNRDRVEQVRGQLADYSLGGRVTTRDVNGELYYRLRVGPYENHSEAEKFLGWIKEIEGFEEAYISEEYPLRTVNG
ncbi:MAG: SPOR domain-containing protein [Alkalispirochaeta sp.]